jgi:hypothetical protein
MSDVMEIKMANNKKDYQVGYDAAITEIKTLLVNGIDEFRKISIFIHSILGNIQVPQDADTKSFYEGVVDACNEAWKNAKLSEIADLESEQRQVADDYKRMLEAKKSA